MTSAIVQTVYEEDAPRTSTIPALGAQGQHYKNWPNEAGFNAQQEQIDPVQLEVKGKFPSYVSGRLMRTGPGAYHFPRTNPEDGYFTSSHWFDGFSHVHKFDVQPQADGNTCIIYQSRRQADKRLEKARKTGKLEGFTFGQKRDPCDSLFKKVKAMWEPARTPEPGHIDIGVAFLNSIHPGPKEAPPGRKSLTATSDQPRVMEFDLDTLEPFGVINQSTLHPELDGHLSAAHPCTDPDTGDYFNYNLKFGPRPVYKVFRTNARDGSTDVLATVTGIEASYLHSSFLTKNFFVLCIWPAYFTMGGAKVLWDRNLLDAIDKFNTERQTKWLVIDRHHGRGVVARFTSPAMFCFHSINSWEKERDDGAVDLFCELIEYPNLDVLHQFYMDSLTSMAPRVGSNKATESASLTRYRLPNVKLPLATESGHERRRLSNNHSARSEGQTAELMLRAAGGELPTINPALCLQPHRYVYGVADRGQSSFLDCIIKTDTETGECAYWSAHGQTPGEPIFVRDPQGEQEQDGTLLSVVLDGVKGTSYLLALDAGSLKEVARAEVPCAIGLGFHGCFIT